MLHKRNKTPPLPRTFYDRDVVEVARDLLGKTLCRDTPAGLAAGRIVEVEAYLGEHDAASHAYRGPTRRNASMFGPPGHAYVYAIHSRWCLNVVAEPAGVAHAVLLRALEPLAGIELMEERRLLRWAADVAAGHRARNAQRKPQIRIRELARGPARLCEALAIDRSLDGWDLTRGQTLWISAAPIGPTGAACTLEAGFEVRATPRIGVTAAKDLPLRFAIADCPFASGPKRT